ncbi:MAG: hypothetical protein CMN30_07740 [Sandaracinus sp.]|nr:hypothetical protein [Sandaracinus sp.]
MRHRLPWVLGALALGAVACTEDPADSDQEVESVDVVPAPEPEATPTDDPATDPLREDGLDAVAADTEEAEDEVEPSTLPPEAEAELEELTETLRAASTAAETFETGSTICEAAHASLAAMMEEVARRYPEQVRQTPPRGAFVQACERLPEEAQECLLPRHALAHVEDCRAITERLDPEQRELLQNALGG